MTDISRALDTFWQNRSDDLRWLESLGDLPSRLMEETRKENELFNNPPEAGAGIVTRSGVSR